MSNYSEKQTYKAYLTAPRGEPLTKVQALDTIRHIASAASGGNRATIDLAIKSIVDILKRLNDD